MSLVIATFWELNLQFLPDLRGRVDLVPQQGVNQRLIDVPWELYVADCGTKHSFGSVIRDESRPIRRHPVLLIYLEGVHQHVPFLAPVELWKPACLIFCLEKHAGAAKLYEGLILSGDGRLLRGRRANWWTWLARVARAAAVHEEEGENSIFEGAIPPQGVKEEGAATLLWGNESTTKPHHPILNWLDMR